jgi:putative N6-adenine-specific DNA methylase
MKQAARDRVRAAPAAPAIFASDIAAGAVGKTLANVRAAKLDGFVAVEQADFLAHAAPAAHGVLLANPPYGVRLADQAGLARLYPLVGDALKQRFAGWNAYFFTGDLRLPKLIHLKVARKVPLFNGALECRLFEFPIVAGRHVPGG